MNTAQDHQIYIDGQPHPTPHHFGVIDPATGEVFAQAPAATPDHVDLAVAAARRAQPAWAALPWATRADHIEAIAQALEARFEEFAQLITRETGKPLGGLAGVGARMEVGGALAWIRATAALTLPVEVVQDDASTRIEIHRRPLGVVASITPWNWPLMIAVWHIMPALLAGNTVVMKPSELTPLATLALARLAGERLPPGVLNIVTGPREAGLGEALADHPGIRKIVFTGSTPTGKRIMGSAARHLKRLTLELGGNDAAIVLPDVDPEAVAPDLFAAAFHNNGQTCACLKRLYVPRALAAPLGEALARLARETRVGPGLHPDTQLGPLQNPGQRAIVDRLVRAAWDQGAHILTGGEALPGPGYFYAPTIVADARAGMALVDEEQFGPALPLIPYDDVEDALAQANANGNGLGGSVWGQDLARATALAARLECGTAWVNEHGAIQPNAPFGGVKDSGIGVEFGPHGLAEFTSIQTLKIRK